MSKEALPEDMLYSSYDDDEDLSNLPRGNEVLPEHLERVGKREEPKDELKDEPKDDSETEEVEDEPKDEPKDAPKDEPKEDDPEGEAPKGEQPPAKDDKNVELRVKKALAQRDAAREELAQLRAQLEKSQTKQENVKSEADELRESLETLYEQVEEARAVADTKTAAQLQRQIDAANRTLSKLEAAEHTTAIIAQRNEDATYDKMIDYLEDVVPSLNAKSDEYDPELTRELQFDVDAYIKAGVQPTVALRRAVIRMFRADVFSAAPAETPAQAPAKPKQKAPNIQKALQTAAKEPPSADSRGKHTDQPRIDVANMSDEEFDALPEATKRKMRGDF